MNKTISLSGSCRRGRAIGRIAGAGAVIAVAVSCLTPAGALAAVPGGTWGAAQKVPGLQALGTSIILSVSCASPGNCGAGGLETSSGQQAFVVSEKNGTWGKAEVVPGSAALNTGGAAQVNSVSCASPGNCSAAGGYETPTVRSPIDHSFVVSEKNGSWGKAKKVPGIASLRNGGNPEISSVSCGSPGNCSAGGALSGTGRSQAFVISQVNGTWGNAERVPGLGANTLGVTNSVSCTSAGNCSAGGFYARPPGTALRAFVVNQKNGRWGKALPIPGMGEVASLSCASTGNCSAAGGLFAVSDKNGTWGKAVRIPSLAALSKGGGHHIVSSISCGAGGNCSAGGWYSTGSSADRAFIVSQNNGTWGKAQQIPGLAALETGGFLLSVSCASAGNCSAGGSYTSKSRRHSQGFVISQHNGTWGKAQQIPGLAALSKGGVTEIESVSCATAGNCSAGGFESNPTFQAFVVSQATPTASKR